MEPYADCAEDMGRVQEISQDRAPRTTRENDLIVQDVGMHQSNMVCDVVAEIQ